MSEAYDKEAINALAIDLGADPEMCPGLWLLDESPYGKADCTLPSPLMDDPAAKLWDGLLLEKLGDIHGGFFYLDRCMDKDTQLRWWKVATSSASYLGVTSTAALLAAWEARNEH